MRDTLNIEPRGFTWDELGKPNAPADVVVAGYASTVTVSSELLQAWGRHDHRGVLMCRWELLPGAFVGQWYGVALL